MKIHGLVSCFKGELGRESEKGKGARSAMRSLYGEENSHAQVQRRNRIVPQREKATKKGASVETKQLTMQSLGDTQVPH